MEIPLYSKGNQRYQLLGKRFGNLLVISKDESTRKGQYWKCKCVNCSKMTSVVTSRLLRLKKTTGCRSCSQLKSPCGSLTKTFWHQVQYSAKLGGHALEITMEDAWRLFVNQQHQCALSGVPLVLSAVKGASTASLDRIDSSLGYTKDNVQWVHKEVNRMKSDLDQYRFLAFCALIARKHGSSV